MSSRPGRPRPRRSRVQCRGLCDAAVLQRVFALVLDRAAGLRQRTEAERAGARARRRHLRLLSDTPTAPGADVPLGRAIRLAAEQAGSRSLTDRRIKSGIKTARQDPA